MDTKKLRQKILDLAIRGKLVPQDPNDEPASVLLERIRAEKERLINEGKIKRSKKTATDEEIEAPFEIPESWGWCVVDDFAYVASGSTPSKDAFVDNGIPYIKMYNLRNQKIDFDFHPQYIKPEVHNGKLQRSRTEVGDLIMNIVGPPLGKMAIIPQSLPESNFNQAAVLIRPYIHKEILVKFLFYYLSQMSEINSISTKGSAGQVNISLTQSQNMRIAMPPLSEQQRIVNEIERWFAVIDVLESNEGDLVKAIDQAKSKILALAIHGKLVPQDPNDEPAIELLKRINPKFEPCDSALYKFEKPQKWCLCRIESIANIIGGVSYKKEDIQVNGIRILRGGNVQDGRVIIAPDDVFILDSYYNNENEVKNGDIVVVASTGSSTLIGKTGYAINVPEHTQIGAFLRIIRPNQNLSSCFINYIFLTDDYKIYIRNIAKGSNINNIKNNYLSEYIIALPPYQEQLRIVAKIEELFAVLDSIKESLE